MPIRISGIYAKLIIAAVAQGSPYHASGVLLRLPVK